MSLANIIYTVIAIIPVIALLIIVYYLRYYYPKYFEEKGKNLATKQDIEEITRKVESVKADIALGLSVQQMKYKLKHEACLEALELIDAYFSCILKSPKVESLKQQIFTTERARACHSKLILSCENTLILKKFSEILTGHVDSKPYTDLLNEFRNLIRQELGFGTELELDRESAWISNIICDK